MNYDLSSKLFPVALGKRMREGSEVRMGQNLSWREVLLAMIGIVLGSGIYASVEVLTSLTEIGSQYYSCMHNHRQRSPSNQAKKKNNKQEKGKTVTSYLGFLDLDDS